MRGGGMITSDGYDNYVVMVMMILEDVDKMMVMVTVVVQKLDRMMVMVKLSKPIEKMVITIVISINIGNADVRKYTLWKYMWKKIFLTHFNTIKEPL